MKLINFVATRLNILFLLAIVILASCEEDGLENSVGLKLMSSDSYIGIVDTFSVDISTIMLDSVVSSGDSYGFVGNNINETTGKTSSETYFKIGRSTIRKIGDDEFCDSAVLVLPSPTYYLGDTTTVIKFTIHEVTGDYDEPEFGNFYSHNTLDYDPIPIGSLEFEYNPSVDSMIYIPLTPEFTDKMFTYLDETDIYEDVDGLAPFDDFFHGIVVKTTGAEDIIVGFDFSISNTYFDFFIAEEEAYEEYLDEYKLYFSDEDLQFNHVTTNFEGTPFEMLQPGESLSSVESDNKILMFGNLGIFAKVRVPSMESLLYLNDLGAVLKVELSLVPEALKYQANDLSDNLSIYLSNKYDEPESILYNADQSSVKASLYFDEFYNEGNVYTFDLTTYIKTELSDSFVDNKKSFLISTDISDMGKNLNKLLLMGSEDKMFKPVFKVYYLYL